MKLWELDVLIRVVAPIAGINTNGDIDFLPSATEEEQTKAKKIMDENFKNISIDVTNF